MKKNKVVVELQVMLVKTKVGSKVIVKAMS